MYTPFTVLLTINLLSLDENDSNKDHRISSRMEYSNFIDEDTNSSPTSSLLHEQPENVLDTQESTQKSLTDGNEKCETENTEMYIILLLEKILDRVWHIVNKQKRWKKCNPTQWKVNISKKQRAEGSYYIIKNKIRPAKVPKSVDCSKCKYQCTLKISEEYRSKMCRNYWNLDFKGKKIHSA